MTGHGQNDLAGDRGRRRGKEGVQTHGRGGGWWRVVRMTSQGRSQGGDNNMRSGEMTCGKTCVMEFFPKEMLFAMPSSKGLLSVDNHNILGWIRFLVEGGRGSAEAWSQGTADPRGLYTLRTRPVTVRERPGLENVGPIWLEELEVLLVH